jgi:chemotaxis protein MotB
MSAPATPPIIIIKKKGHHGGHHGGAWKVAYADFVTAMMAFFIVMWLLNASQEVQKAVAGYFRDPRGSAKKAGSAFGGTGESITIDRKNMNSLKNKLEQALKETPKFDKIKNNVQMTITGEGLRIELMENDKGIFFESGQAKPTQSARDLLVQMADQLGKMPNMILIEGHTDAKPFGDANGYTNWELSADRANAARKIMQESGLKPDQIAEIRGFADQQLRLPDKPDDASNRRISIIIKYADAPIDPAKEAAEEKAEGKEGGGAESSKEGEGEAKPAEHGQKPSASPAKPVEGTKPSVTPPVKTGH